jgi:ribosomal protein S27E
MSETAIFRCPDCGGTYTVVYERGGTSTNVMCYPCGEIVGYVVCAGEPSVTGPR